ncbi:hypothetical protein GCM10017621_26090 [Maricaulis virginensis]|uniref:Uncharacterized protein n=1 Tax=Maricaulis virginensis TaxID=144022 RepID=A0A9W6IMN9_9PROT|nr:hypothetical protein GCM10017621_26090 [Maricaulis virginensis]
MPAAGATIPMATIWADAALPTTWTVTAISRMAASPDPDLFAPPGDRHTLSRVAETFAMLAGPVRVALSLRKPGAPAD